MTRYKVRKDTWIEDSQIEFFYVHDEDHEGTAVRHLHLRFVSGREEHYEGYEANDLISALGLDVTASAGRKRGKRD